jgi:asparagine synthase (glutamine-hydrolysing)
MFLKHIDDVVRTQEEPFGSPSVFMQYFVMQKAKENGCKVMLDGQGGDETLLGYTRYFPAFVIGGGLRRLLHRIAAVSQNTSYSKFDILRMTLYFAMPSLRTFVLKRKNGFYTESFVSLCSFDTLKRIAKSYLNPYRLQYLEIYETQLAHLLRYEDKNSMRHSIETRLPFLDYRVLETALSSRDDLKIYRGWSKYILRKATEDILPEEIVWRRDKIGFEAPTETWMRFLHEKMKTTIKNSPLIRAVTGNIPFDSLDEKQMWRLYNAAKWASLYDVKID